MILKELKPTIIDRYILVEFFKTFIASLFLIVVMNHLIELMERLGFFMSKNIEPLKILKYYLFKSPFFIIELSPIAILFSVVFTLGVMGKNREITAIITSGVSYYRIIFYLYITGFILSIFFIFFNEFVVVPAQKKVTEMNNNFRNIYYAKDRRNFSMYGKHNFIYYIRYYNAKAQTMEYIEVLRTSADKSTILWRIDAKLARWDAIKKKWIYQNGVERHFDKGGQIISVENIIEKEIDIPEKPADFEYIRTDISELSISDALKYINRLKYSGFPYQKELVDFHIKFAFPFACLLMMLIGAPLSLYSTRSILVISMGLALLGSFTYWVILNIGISLGKNGVLPAVISAWIGNIIFLGISFYIHKKIPT